MGREAVESWEEKPAWSLGRGREPESCRKCRSDGDSGPISRGFRLGEGTLLLSFSP